MHPKGLEVVTIALDTEGLPAAKYFIERAEPEHPALVDQKHLMDELFGVVNVPTGIWIDEHGVIVRPPEPAFPEKIGFRIPKGLEDLDPYIAGVLEETKHIRRDERYVPALRDWVEHGADSRYALPAWSIWRVEKVATPATAATVVVPERVAPLVPVPAVIVSVTSPAKFVAV